MFLFSRMPILSKDVGTGTPSPGRILAINSIATKLHKGSKKASASSPMQERLSTALACTRRSKFLAFRPCEGSPFPAMIGARTQTLCSKKTRSKVTLYHTLPPGHQLVIYVPCSFSLRLSPPALFVPFLDPAGIFQAPGALGGLHHGTGILQQLRHRRCAGRGALQLPQGAARGRGHGGRRVLPGTNAGKERWKPRPKEEDPIGSKQEG